jgi:hypothetical protein
MRYDSLPEHMREGARLYIEQGIPPGGFMMAVLCDSLTKSFSRADHINLDAMQNWTSWLFNDCPRPAWGSLQSVETWVSHRGLAGISEAA